MDDFTESLTDRVRLLQAVKDGDVRKARIILEVTDSALDGSKYECGQTLLMVACYNTNPLKRLNMINMLLDRKPAINSMDENGRTVLSHAMELGCSNVIRNLIHHHNIDPDAADYKGNTPLIYGARYGHEEALRLLIQNFRRLGLGVEHVNEDGFTALLTAAKYGHLACCRVLVNQGRATVSIRDTHTNRPAIEWLREQKFDTASLDFLRPIARFYRAAKLASSLAKGTAFSSFEMKPSQRVRGTSPVKDVVNQRKRLVKIHRDAFNDVKNLSTVGKSASATNDNTVHNCAHDHCAPILGNPSKEDELCKHDTQQGKLLQQGGQAEKQHSSSKLLQQGGPAEKQHSSGKLHVSRKGWIEKGFGKRRRSPTTKILTSSEEEGIASVSLADDQGVSPTTGQM